MNIKTLFRNIPHKILSGSNECEVTNLAYDSRKVEEGTLFACLKSIKGNIDGHDYAMSAIEKGATALLVERTIDCIPEDITVVQVDNARHALSMIASVINGEPSKKVNLVGVTGTNGKTSTTYFMSEILKNAGYLNGIISTIETKVGDTAVAFDKNVPTTPESVDLHPLFKYMIEQGASHITMEASSMALKWHRVDACDFDIGVFTNLTLDHLDDHGSFEDYKQSKFKLFNLCKMAVVNVDDIVGHEIVELHKDMNIVTYGINNAADIMATNIVTTAKGATFRLTIYGETKSASLNIPGRFSIYNALAAAGACHLLGLSLSQICEGIGKICSVRGRFESIVGENNISAIVDYAHTPDALENVLHTTREFTKKKVITVFGCGGNRDKTKRPIMGEIAGNNSDICIITSDNPRFEKSEEIIEQIENGVKKTNCKYIKIEDRAKAIEYAMELASDGDTIIVAGKGHETYQEINGVKNHFDDFEVLKKCLKK